MFRKYLQWDIKHYNYIKKIYVKNKEKLKGKFETLIKLSNGKYYNIFL